ncbi:MAG TPA: hypothetical protein VFN53_07210 [Acidobacteriaceae bacterium]|nr:hypothetical protein [Acidobacteriaceae bacterium]
MLKDPEQEYRLQRFWGVTVFSLGILWGMACLIYFPIAALTSIRGSSWLEVGVILTGGMITLVASAGAFFQRRFASVVLIALGVPVLAVAIAGQLVSRLSASGAINVALMMLSGGVMMGLGIFGWATERKGWPVLREPR